VEQQGCGLPPPHYRVFVRMYNEAAVLARAGINFMMGSKVVKANGKL